RLSRLPRGYDRVARRLGRGIPVRLGERVRELRWTSAGVSAVTDLGVHDARRAVVTLPLGVLQARAVRFVPELPRWKRDSIDAIEMGPVVKVALLFDRPHWPADLLFVHARGEAVPTFWRPLPSRAPALIGWAASLKADALRGRDAVSAALASLRAVVGSR